MFRIDYQTPKIWITLIVFLFCWTSHYAQKNLPVSKENLNIQSPTTSNEETPAGCRSSEMMDKLFKDHPELRKVQDQINRLSRERIYGNQSFSGHTHPHAALSGTVYTIPVVVHVVHGSGVPVGTDENLSDAQIQQGIDDMTNAFRNTGTYVNGSGYDVEIEFCLASQDESGSFTTGITRTESDAYTELNSDTEDATLKSSSVAEQWDPTKYCNIWLVREICDNTGACGVAGYAYLAGAHGNSLDGIVNEASYFGSSTNNSKVHIHEMGHYLNLYHTFEGGCTNDDCTTDGDFVCDTPPDNSTSATCSGANSCTTDTNSGFSTDQNDMTENYMDYGFQSCQYWFTAGQATRMRDALTTTRASLLSSQGCVDPSSPEIYFSVASMSVDETATNVVAGCGSYRDVTITMGIGSAPTGNADITFSFGGTAISDVDYQSTTGPEITFPSGADTDQTFNLRVWDDGAIEGEETIEISFSLSGSTDATAASFNQTLTITIDDDDMEPLQAGSATLLDEDFEGGFPTGWSAGIFSGSSSNGSWTIGSGGLASTVSLYMASGGVRGDDASEDKRLGIFTSTIDATGYSNDMTLSFDLDIGGSSSNDFFEIFYRLGSSGSWSILTTNIHTFSGTYETTLPSGLNGNSFQVGLIWNQNGDGTITGNVPAFDNVQVTVAAQPAKVQSNLCSAEFYFGPNDTVYVYNNDSILARLINLSSHDYGCTTFEVDRTGTGAVMYENSSTNSYPSAKTFKITPTTNNSSGAYKICLYYSEDEVLGWEAATGNSRSDLGLLKASDAISDISGVQALGTLPTNGAYNTDDYYVEATFNTGFSGFAAISQTNSPLPIELLSWKAQLLDEHVQLSWSAVELPGFSHYELQRSTNGKEFTTVHWQYRSGEANIAQDYVYNDPLHQISGSTIYYRLKNVEEDDSYVFSEIRTVQLPKHSFGIASVIPNPFNQSLTVKLATPQTQEVSLEVISVDGRTVQRITLDDVDETRVVHLNNLSDLKSGIYFLRLSTLEGQQAFQKIIKK